MKILAIVVSCFFWLNLYAQEIVVFELKCIDKTTREAIPNVQVLVQQGDSIFQRTTALAGTVQLKIAGNVAFAASFTHGYYEAESLEIQPTKSAVVAGKITKIVELAKIKAKTLGEVNVYAPGAVEVVFQSERLSVADFEIFPTGELLLLAYPKTLSKGSELLVYNGKEILQSFKLKEKPTELIHDFRGNAHVVCENGVYGIYRTASGIGISNIDKSYYMKYIFPVVDTIQTKLFFSNFNPVYPAFDYMAVDQLDSTYKVILEIKDDLMMELYRSEYKWVDVRTKLWAYNKQLETGIDKEIWVGANYFTNSVYYKQLYAPMFQRNDSVFVFDYYKDKLFTFDAFGNKVDSVSIFHHYQPKQTGWKRNVMQDKVTGEVYAFFEKGGICSVQKINLKTGALGDKIQFEHKYIDKLAIHGNKAYYVYRPFESAQKKFLYLTQLP